MLCPPSCFCLSSPNKILSDVLNFDQFWQFQLKNCKYTPKLCFFPFLPLPWHSHWGVMGGGQSAPLDNKKIAKNWKKSEKIMQENGETGGKIGKVLSLPPPQIGLTTLLCPPLILKLVAPLILCRTEGGYRIEKLEIIPYFDLRKITQSIQLCEITSSARYFHFILCDSTENVIFQLISVQEVIFKCRTPCIAFWKSTTYANLIYNYYF